MKKPWIHPNAIVESKNIGSGTRIWAFAHVMMNVRIGTNCNIGDGVFLESGVRIGNGVTIKNNALLWTGITLEDYVFVGPGVVFTNDRYPRSPRLPLAAVRYKKAANWMLSTCVQEGASIGANATIMCGITLGAFCTVAAGSVVTYDIPPFRLCAGNPARLTGYVDKSGQVLKGTPTHLTNPVDGRIYKYCHNKLIETTKP
jgi:UDP-2-acetamido-3-amino-2,3-dideoxy-glucuronate N-acetyltransferase